MNWYKTPRFQVLISLCVATVSSAVGQSSFEFEGREVASGTKEHFVVKIGEGTTSTDLPITVFHGATNGPVLGITAGVHGYEYAPILAGQELIKTLDPEALKGTVILMQIANPSGFLGREPYLNPKDGKNLNRSFPGSKSGTITDQIAFYLSDEVIARCDFFIDMHSGDAPEDLMPYAAYYAHADEPESSRVGKAMASSMGFDYVVVFDATGKDYMSSGLPSLYCSAEAFKRGIPAADIECGRLGLVESKLVHQIVVGVTRLLETLEMCELPKELREISGDDPKYIQERSFLSSKHSGIFYPLVASGDQVNKGAKIGYITDFFNRPIMDVYADL